MFPRPIADPAAARIKPRLLPQCSLFSIMVPFITQIKFLQFCCKNVAWDILLFKQGIRKNPHLDQSPPELKKIFGGEGFRKKRLLSCPVHIHRDQESGRERKGFSIRKPPRRRSRDHENSSSPDSGTRGTAQVVYAGRIRVQHSASSAFRRKAFPPPVF